MSSTLSIVRPSRMFRVKVRIPGVAPYQYTAKANSSCDCISFVLGRLNPQGDASGVRVSAVPLN